MNPWEKVSGDLKADDTDRLVGWAQNPRDSGLNVEDMEDESFWVGSLERGPKAGLVKLQHVYTSPVKMHILIQRISSGA